MKKSKIGTKSIALLLAIVMLACLTAGCSTQQPEQGNKENPTGTPLVVQDNNENPVGTPAVVQDSNENPTATPSIAQENEEAEASNQTKTEEFPLEELGWTYEDGLYHTKHRKSYIEDGKRKGTFVDIYSKDGKYWYEDGEPVFIYDVDMEGFIEVSPEEALAIKLLDFDLEELKKTPHYVHNSYGMSDAEYKSSLNLSSYIMYSGDNYHCTSYNTFYIRDSSVEETYVSNEAYVIQNQSTQDTYSYDNETKAWDKKTETSQDIADVLDLIKELEDIKAEENYDEDEGITTYRVNGALPDEITKKLVENSPYLDAPNAYALCRLDFNEDKNLVSFYIRIYSSDNFTISGLDELEFETLTVENDTIEGFKQENYGTHITVYFYDNYKINVPVYVLNQVGELDLTVPSWVSEKVPRYDTYCNLYWKQDNKEFSINLTGKEGWYFDLTAVGDYFAKAYIDTSNGMSEHEDYMVRYQNSYELVDHADYEDERFSLSCDRDEIMTFEHNGRTNLYCISKIFDDCNHYSVLQDIGYDEYLRIDIYDYNELTEEEAENEALNVIKNFLLEL